jgi:peptidoglycan hydrolase CwlO-like protein
MTEKKMTLEEYEQSITDLEGKIDEIDAKIVILSEKAGDARRSNDERKEEELFEEIRKLKRIRKNIFLEE